MAPEPTAPTQADDPVQDNITQYWRGRADSYDDHRHSPARSEPDHQVWTNVLRHALPIVPCDVLDVGTGTGYVAGIVAEQGHRVTGIDLAPEMLEVAATNHRGHPNPPRLLPGDAVDPPFDEASFDVITSRYVLWTLRRPEVALATWKTLLRPGGKLAVLDSTWFPRGINDGTPVETGSRQADFRRLYDATVRASLPLAESTSIEASADRIAAAGFAAVTVTPLEALYQLDARVGVSEGHEVQMQYLITGMVP